MYKIISGVIALLFLMGIPAIGEEKKEEPKNLIDNPGFEESEPFTVPGEWKEKKKLVEATELPKEVSINQIYPDPGKVSVVYAPETSHGGMKYINIEGYIGLMCGGNTRKCNPGEKYVFSVWAKGKGKLLLYFYLFNQRMYQPQAPKGNPCMSQAFDLSGDQWQECKWEVTIPEAKDAGKVDENADITSGIVRHFAVAYHIENGTVDLDDACLFKK